MRGQVSLELLVVLAIFLAVLGAWMAGVVEVQAEMGRAFGAESASIAAGRLASAMDSACVMGDGNREALDIYLPDNATVGVEGNRLVLRYVEKSSERPLICRGSGSISESGTVSVENRDDVIYLSSM